MTCHERDPDLLLLAHGALPWAQRLRAQTHLLLCSDCRVRFAQLAHVSTLLAAEVREPTMPPWSRPAAIARTSRRPPHWRLALVVTVLIVALGLGIWIAPRLVPHMPNGIGGTSAPAPGGCRPDLPNSRCR